MLKLTRSDENPIVLPSSNDWERRAAFNGNVVFHEGIFHMVYRALSNTQYYQGHSMSLSTIGYTESQDGVTFGNHKQLIQPEYFWETFGCEDPPCHFF